MEEVTKEQAIQAINTLVAASSKAHLPWDAQLAPAGVPSHRQCQAAGRLLQAYIEQASAEDDEAEAHAVSR